MRNGYNDAISGCTSEPVLTRILFSCLGSIKNSHMKEEKAIMSHPSIKQSILFQLDMCWQLFLYHTDTLEETEAFWAFSPTDYRLKDKTMSG